MRNLFGKIWLWIRGLEGIDDPQGAYLHSLEHRIMSLEQARDQKKTAQQP